VIVSGKLRKDFGLSSADYYFQIQLLVRHPEIDPDEITDALGLTPDRSWKAGDQRSTPAGSALAGKYQLSNWSHSWEVVGERCFFKCAENIVRDLQCRQSFFVQLADDRGETMLNIQLYGKGSIGDVASPNFQTLLQSMGIRLGIEVFPEWHKADAIILSNVE